MRHISLIAAILTALVVVGCDTAKVVREGKSHYVVTGAGPAPFCGEKCAKSRAERAAKALCPSKAIEEVYPPDKPADQKMAIGEFIKTASTAVDVLKGALSLFGTNTYTGRYVCSG